MKKVFKDLDHLRIIELNFRNTTGRFAHDPNPLIAANLADLRQRVLEEKANFGLCFDGDADRAIFVDERAEIIGCDHLTAMMAGHFLKSNPGAGIVFDLRSSRTVEEEINRAGGRPIRSRVGHVFMKQALREHGAVFGGELSGHFYFRDNFNADSGAIAFAQVLSILALTKRRLSELIKPFTKYSQSGEINFMNEEKELALQALEEHFAGAAEISHLDGLTIDCFRREGWWCNVRQSNTEPVLRLNLEARNEVIRDRMINEIAPMLGHRVAH